jgi:protein-S-isoprenylcysteine O-methyltransferase Ste14
MQPQETTTQEESARIRQGVRLWTRKQAIGLIFMVTILFFSAGRLDWLNGWISVIITVVFIFGHATILIRKTPALLAERSRVPGGAKRWDIWLTSAAVIWLPVVTWIVAGLDFRLGWTEPYPVWTLIIAVAVIAVAYAFVTWAMVSNPFFSAIVRIQKDRGHCVVSGGPYRYVRHPGYLGVIPSLLLGPIVLNSSWALIPSTMSAILLTIRTALEDRTLHAELEGYREYALRVRYRLIPGIW